MTIAYAGQSTSVVAASGNVTLTEPGSAVSGDLLVAHIAFREAAEFSIPGGWTLIKQDAVAASDGSGYWQGSGLLAFIVRGASAPSFVFTRTGGGVAIGNVFRYTKSAALDWSLVASSSQRPPDLQPQYSAPSIDAPAGARIILAYCGGGFFSASGQGAAIDPDTGWTDHWDDGSGSGTTGVRMSFASAAKVGAGATGLISGSASYQGRHLGIAAAFAEIDTTPPPTPTGIVRPMNAGFNNLSGWMQ